MAEELDTGRLQAWVREFARTVADHREQLTELDSAIGDADHGANMDRGLAAAVAALDATPPADPAALLKQVGMTLVSKVGGASGPLYGTLFLRMAGAGGATPWNAAVFGRALRAGLDALDAALADGKDLGAALRAGVDAARAGRDATVPMQARKGRASYLGERSIGHQDPGATSTVLMLEAAATTLAGARD
jgi:phosphoenolpyruvate---glycerone phosphotransferase subunit DhaL